MSDFFWDESEVVEAYVELLEIRQLEYAHRESSHTIMRKI